MVTVAMAVMALVMQTMAVMSPVAVLIARATVLVAWTATLCGGALIADCWRSGLFGQIHGQAKTKEPTRR